MSFVWHTFDMRSELPSGWQDEILTVARSHAVSRTLIPTSVTSRETSPNLRIPVQTVGGVALREHLPWLVGLYHGRFRELAQQLSSEPIATAQDPRYGINLNVQMGMGYRYECHVDSNPLEGLLYVTDHPSGRGGDLVVSNMGDVSGVDDVDRNATRIHPVAGYLIFFDARKHSHYVSELVHQRDIRVVAAMNFYTPSCREQDRPADLNRHLFGSS